MDEILTQIGHILGYEARVAILGACVSTIFSGAIAYFLARKYGDIAGAQAAIEFEKEKAREAYKTALLALFNQTRVAKELAKRNIELASPNVRRAQPVVRMPVTSFETAFLIGKESLLASNYYERSQNNTTQDSLDNISLYLSEAYSINTLVDLYINLIRGLSSTEEASREDVITRLKAKSEEILEILNRLEDQLKRDFEAG